MSVASAHSSDASLTRAALELLERHVPDRPAEARIVPSRRGEFRHAEVRYLHPTVPHYEHVRRFDVEVQYAVFVGERESVAHGFDDCRSLIEREGSPDVVEQFSETGTIGVLRDEECLVGVSLEVVDGDDGRVVEHCSGARLGKTWRIAHDRAGSVIVRELEPLDGDASVHPRVPRERDGRIAAAPEFFERTVAFKDELLLHEPPVGRTAGAVSSNVFARARSHSSRAAGYVRAGIPGQPQ